ncbi:sugar ABC transporter permease [uncultured Sphaerochaeta sp.]|uniref:carbohydrate ABC transporter permease n=1 Tax=uncultured Sphaerochaeta sp. TaxID=886478 RepID=UPI002A0A80A5|nr:sugar ABC transporter permease [uncultured Sphaerochaeta sp.]
MEKQNTILSGPEMSTIKLVLPHPDKRHIHYHTDYRYIIPGVVFVAVMTQIPFLITIIFSFIKWNLSRPDIPTVFAGFSNYWFFIKSIEFWQILWQTVLITGISLGLCTILGFLMALLLDNEVPFINVARTLILGPFFVMSTASGVIWKTTIFNTIFGWYGVLAQKLNFTPVDWISYHPVGVIILLFIWQWMPFFVLILLAGLQGISKDLTDCMQLDGVNWLQGTFLIKLPLISNQVRVAVMLGLVFLIKEFGLILVTTNGGPGKSSYTLPFYVYYQTVYSNQIGRAGALAVITVALTLILIRTLYTQIKKRSI